MLVVLLWTLGVSAEFLRATNRALAEDQAEMAVEMEDKLFAKQMNYDGKSFSITLKRRPPHLMLSQQSAVSVLKSKYSSRLHSKVVHASEYYGQIEVGDQSFLVVFDTGSGNLLLPSVQCSDEACTSHKRFDSTKSKSATQIAFADQPDKKVQPDGDRDVVTITFGTGETSGVFVKDRICVGDICANGDFVAATSESDEPFSLVPFDGILGLALPQMSEGDRFNLVDCMIQQKVLKLNLFSVFFGATDAEQSEISFGEFKKERMLSAPLWANVTTPGYWQVAMADITLNGTHQKLCGKNGCQVAVDTGTSLLAGPSDIINTLIDTIDVATDCANYAQLPKLGFVVNGEPLELDPEDYVDKDTEGHECSVGLMTLDVPPPKGPLFIFGDPFLRKFYTIFDRENMRVGFAKARHSHPTDKTVRKEKA
jgi:cathepsin D